MSRRNFCQACSFIKHGVKTRKSIPHTCNLAPKTYVTLLALDAIDGRVFWKDDQTESFYFARLPFEMIERYKKDSSQNEVNSALSCYEDFKRYDEKFTNIDALKEFIVSQYVEENKKIGREVKNVSENEVKIFVSYMPKDQLLKFISEINVQRIDERHDKLIEYVKENQFYDPEDEQMLFKEL